MTEPTARDVLAEALDRVPVPAARSYVMGGGSSLLMADSILNTLAARGYTLSPQPEAAGEAGLHVAVMALPSTFHFDEAVSPTVTPLVSRAAVLALLAAPEPAP